MPLTLSADGRTVTTGYDSLGRVTSYTDADGNTSITSYDLLDRPTSRSDGKGTQTYSYNPTSGLLTGLDDTQAGSFTASYDPDGNLTSETYPNGLRADTVHDESGAPTDLTYTKQGCSANCVWFDEHIEESIHGQWLSRDSSLSDQRYAYDKAGRLVEVEDTPAGQGCTTRSYQYDLDSNRTSKTTRAPAVGGACDTTSAGQVQLSSYDAADRITNDGFAYDSFGRITTVPASHAGGGALQTSYYINDMVRSQTQDGTTKSWLLDPTQARHRASVPNGSHQEILHYADGSDSPAWSAQTDNGAVTGWQRNIEGIDGDLAATHDSQTGTQLQLPNLHGDTVATASPDPNATAPTDTFEADEFGNPLGENGQRYGWLGAKQRRTELPSGVVQMGVRSYVPAMGRFTTVDPVRGGSANSYEYTSQDPLNRYDLDGRAHQSIACYTRPRRPFRAGGQRVVGRARANCTQPTPGGAYVAFSVCVQVSYFSGAWSNLRCRHQTFAGGSLQSFGLRTTATCQRGTKGKYRTWVGAVLINPAADQSDSVIKTSRARGIRCR